MNSTLAFIAIVSFSVVAATLWLLGQFLYPRRADDMRGKTAADEQQDSIAAARLRLQAAQDDAMNEAQQKDYQQEINQQLLEEVRASESVADESTADETAPKKDYLAAAIVCLSLLILPAALYAIVGTPSAWQPTAPAAIVSDGEAPNIDELVTRLETRLTANPDDASTAYWLGRVAAAQGDLTKAQQSFARAYELDSQNPDIIAAYADSLISAPAATNSNIDIAALLESGLAIDKNHAILLWLRGAHAESQGELETAINYWQRAADTLASNPEQQQEILTIIADTKHQLALQSGEQPTAPTTSDSQSQVIVIVDARPALTANPALATAILFVYAQAADEDAPPMPLAVYRQASSTFPLTVTLNDSLAMLPTQTMSRYTHYHINARLSPSGSATPSPSDISTTNPNTPQNTTITLTLK